MDKNLILYDWLSFTVLDFGLDDIKELLGLSNMDWQLFNGSKGYQFRQSFKNVSLLYGGEFHPEIFVEMSGQGCRSYETYGANDWDGLINWLNEFALNVTRIDVSFDDHTGVLDIDEMYWDAHSFNYVSKARTFDFRFTDKGKTIYVGSPSSAVWICIYDKARERKDISGAHWIRVELRLKDERASNFIKSPGTLGERFCGVMLHYLRFVEPEPADSNKWRWPLKQYWAEFLDEAIDIALWSSPGVEYNLLRCENYVYGQGGSAIHTLLEIYGPDIFMQKLSEQRPKNLDPKYTALINQYK